jgi:O-antigen/teichoic acid export membrane protein
VLQFSNKTVILISISMSLIGAGVVLAIADRVGPAQARAFWAGCLLLPFLALTRVRQAALRGFKSIFKAQLPDGVLNHLFLAVFLLGAGLLARQTLTAPSAMLLTVFSNVIVFVIGTAWLISSVPIAARTAKAQYERVTWIKTSLPILVITSMNLIMRQADILMIGTLRGPKDAGIYAAATRIVELVVVGNMAVNAIAAPLFSELYHTGRTEELQRILRLAARGVFGFTMVVGLGLLLFGKPTLGLFGKAFTASYYPLLILLAGQVVNSLAGSVGFLMTMTGHQNHAAFVIGTSAAINVALNYLLIPIFGIMGAAISSAVATALWNMVLLVYVRTRLGLNPALV